MPPIQPHKISSLLPIPNSPERDSKSQELKTILLKGIDKLVTEVMKVQDFIKLSLKEDLFGILIKEAESDNQSDEGENKAKTKIGIMARGILKYLKKTIQPTTYYVKIIGESVNKLQYRKLLKFYGLDPKDFVKQNPDELYKESQSKGMLKAAQKVSKERLDKLKSEKLQRQNVLQERQQKMLEMQRKKDKEKENQIENTLHVIGEKVLSHDRSIKSEGLQDLIIIASKNSRHLINIHAFQILLDEVINDICKSEDRLSYNDTGKILAFLIDMIPSATFFFNSRAEKLLSAGTVNLMVTNSKLKTISQFFLSSLAKYGQINTFLPLFIKEFNKVTVSAVAEKGYILECTTNLLKRLDKSQESIVDSDTIEEIFKLINKLLEDKSLKTSTTPSKKTKRGSSKSSRRSKGKGLIQTNPAEAFAKFMKASYPLTKEKLFEKTDPKHMKRIFKMIE